MATTKKAPAAKPAKGEAPRLKLTLVRSLIGWPEKQRKIVAALGFHRTNSTVEVVDTPTIRGMVRKITHLISIESLV